MIINQYLFSLIITIITLLIPSLASAEIRTESIFDGETPLITCPPSHRRGIKSCTRINATLIKDYKLPIIYGASYRKAPGTYVELEIDFRETSGDFEIVIDGEAYSIQDEISTQRYKIPVTNNEMLNVTIRSRVGNEQESVLDTYNATVKSVRIILDNSNFQDVLKSRQELYTSFYTSLKNIQMLRQYEAALDILYEASRSFYEKLSGAEIQKLSVLAKESDLVTMLSNIAMSENACFWENIDSPKQTCLTDKQKGVIPVLLLSIRSTQIPELWKNPDGTVKSFSEYLQSLSPSDPDITVTTKSVMDILGKQGTDDLKKKHNNEFDIIEKQKEILQKEISELSIY